MTTWQSAFDAGQLLLDIDVAEAEAIALDARALAAERRSAGAWESLMAHAAAA